ncbi:MAG: 50S ribosomal protein L15 [Armatimonadetes bacterium]|nr:50S ribosomal protein L15 [Candidatus Hippobium faecium]
MRLHDLKPNQGSTHSRKRVGRGPGSGHGTTAGRGMNGQKSRSNVGLKIGFEGGQTPLYRKFPQKKGFNNINRKEFVVVNVAKLEEVFDAGSVVTIEALLDKKCINGVKDGVKILGDGELTKALTVKANKFSAVAVEKIKACGGTVEVI